ncbi:MAG: molybdopterin-binding protein [Pseudomonadota bacterium]
MKYNLFEKTELWISPIKLNEVDLGECARASAEVLGLDPDEIMVTDVLEDSLTLDVLVPIVEAEKIVGRGKDLLAALASIPGVHITPETQIHSQGILGFIALDEELGKEVLDRSRKMSAQIEERIRRRCLIFASGNEILSGQIRDTNTPFLIDALRSEGYNVSEGPTLEDRAVVIARVFRESAANGYGLLITTGGIGAEGKDQTLEALSTVDPHANMPYIMKFHKGHGRHQKEGVRIGVGVLNGTLIVCLPGPHDELQLAWPVLREGLKHQWGKEVLAESLAKKLRHKFLSRNTNQAHTHRIDP